MASNGTSDQTGSQRYLSTRGEDVELSFEEVVLNGLAFDGGLYLPEEIPTSTPWQSWNKLNFPELAFEIMSLYISPSEVPHDDLKDIIQRSYSSFRSPEITPLVRLYEGHHLLELFHGPTYALDDVAVRFLGNLFEYFLARKNEGKTGTDRQHLTVLGATSGDTGSAVTHSLRGKKDISLVNLYPQGRVSPIQEAQMTTFHDKNVHNLAVTGTYDDCQDIVSALFGDAETRETLEFSTCTTTNWGRVLAHIVYYFSAYFSLAKSSSSFKLGDKVRFVVPTGDFDIISGYFALRMGLPIDKLIIATNENNIIGRFLTTGKFEIAPSSPAEAEAVNPSPSEGVKETLSPAMDLLVPRNAERLLWFLAYEFAASAGMDDTWNQRQAGQEVSQWNKDFKAKGTFGPVYQDVLRYARRDFECEEVTDEQTLETIRSTYKETGYVLDPHAAVGVVSTGRSIARAGPDVAHISLATIHPGKFSGAVTQALGGEDSFDFAAKVLPAEFVGLEQKEKKFSLVGNDWQNVRDIVIAQVTHDLEP